MVLQFIVLRIKSSVRFGAMKKILVLFVTIVSLVLPRVGFAETLYTFWQELSYAQKVILLVGYNRGVCAICQMTAEEVALKRIYETKKIIIGDKNTWPTLDEIREATDDTYSSCVVVHGIVGENAGKEAAKKAIRTIDYAYVERGYNINLSYLIVMCSRLDNYKKCVDDQIARIKSAKRVTP